MRKKSVPPTSHPESSPSPDAKPGYSIGYGQPPRHTRFRPGRSGNPNGKPKQRRNVRTVVEDILGQRITVREGNRTRALTKLEGIILTMVNAVLKGDAKALTSWITLLRSLGMISEAEQNLAGNWNLRVLTDEELAELRRLMRKVQGNTDQA